MTKSIIWTFNLHQSFPQENVERAMPCHRHLIRLSFLPSQLLGQWCWCSESRPVGPVGEKILKRYIHRSFLNSNYSSITSQKLFANKNIKDYHILPHSFHKITSTYHFHYLIHFSKSSVPTISLPHSFSQNHHSQFITPPFIFTKSSQLIMSSSRSFH